MIQVLENILTTEQANELEDIVLDGQGRVRFHYSPDVTFGEGKGTSTGSMNVQLYHERYNEEKEEHQYFKPIINAVENRLNKQIKRIVRSRAGILFASNDRTHNNPHIDLRFPHTVILYYINDADGDTVFFEEDKIVKRVTPKKNTAVVFDGYHVHASSCPSVGIRSVYNVDVILED